MSRPVPKKKVRDGIILVFYVNIGNLDGDVVDEYLSSVRDRMEPDREENERFIYVAVRNQDSKIECIYPQQILTSQDSVEKFNELIGRLESIYRDRTIMTINKPNKFEIKGSQKL